MGLYDIAIAKKLISEGGGGGSSDFSTAEVTTVMNQAAPIYIPYLYEDGSESAMVSLGITDGGTYLVPMYKGVLAGGVAAMAQTVQVSGNAEWDAESETVTITGDCTITIEAIPEP